MCNGDCDRRKQTTRRPKVKAAARIPLAEKAAAKTSGRWQTRQAGRLPTFIPEPQRSPTGTDKRSRMGRRTCLCCADRPGSCYRVDHRAPCPAPLCSGPCDHALGVPCGAAIRSVTSSQDRRHPALQAWEEAARGTASGATSSSALRVPQAPAWQTRRRFGGDNLRRTCGKRLLRSTECFVLCRDSLESTEVVGSETQLACFSHKADKTQYLRLAELLS